jgi:ubiquinone/menaquinone biosynthesis C-methylase UbiE
MSEKQAAWDAEYRRKGTLWRGERGLPPQVAGMVLELGCGDGKGMCRTDGADIIGVDISREGLALCAARTGDGHRLLHADATRLPFSEGCFDHVLAVHVLENLEDAEVRALAQETARVLRPDGRLWVRCFHPDDMRSPAKGGKAERSGIAYRYRDEGYLEGLMGPLRMLSVGKEELRKRYGGREYLRISLVAVLAR